MNTNLPQDYEFSLHLFHEGNLFEAFKFFGAHKGIKDDKEGVYFRVWAPKAKSVSVVFDANNWDRDKNPMEKLTDNGIWETFLADVPDYFAYLYFDFISKNIDSLNYDYSKIIRINLNF